MTQTCPSCSQPATGRFCSRCGASLDAPAACRECGNELPAGARFCNGCGVPVSATPEPAPSPADVRVAEREGSAASPASNLPWYVAGAALIALIAVLLIPRFRDEPVNQPPFAAPEMAGAAMGDPRAVDLASMTPREAADSLFQRVMRSVSAGDTAQVRFFTPMALQAYARVPELDDDARYHIGTLHLLGGDPAAARAQADTILASEPDHLFGLSVAAQAETARGDAETARDLYRQFLDAYAGEIERDLPEYQAHARALPQMRAEAQQSVSAAGS